MRQKEGFENYGHVWNEGLEGGLCQRSSCFSCGSARFPTSGKLNSEAILCIPISGYFDILSSPQG